MRGLEKAYVYLTSESTDGLAAFQTNLVWPTKPGITVELRQQLWKQPRMLGGSKRRCCLQAATRRAILGAAGSWPEERRLWMHIALSPVVVSESMRARSSARQWMSSHARQPATNHTITHMNQRLTSTATSNYPGDQQPSALMLRCHLFMRVCNASR